MFLNWDGRDWELGVGGHFSDGPKVMVWIVGSANKTSIAKCKAYAVVRGWRRDAHDAVHCGVEDTSVRDDQR